jgi:hypothetical protein
VVKPRVVLHQHPRFELAKPAPSTLLERTTKVANPYLHPNKTSKMALQDKDDAFCIMEDRIRQNKITPFIEHGT